MNFATPCGCKPMQDSCCEQKTWGWMMASQTTSHHQISPQWPWKTSLSNRQAFALHSHISRPRLKEFCITFTANELLVSCQQKENGLLTCACRFNTDKKLSQNRSCQLICQKLVKSHKFDVFFRLTYILTNKVRFS